MHDLSIKLDDYAEAREDGDGIFFYFIPDAFRPTVDGVGPPSRLVRVALQLHNPNPTTVTVDVASEIRAERFWDTPTDQDVLHSDVVIAPGGFYRLEETLHPGHNTLKITRSTSSNQGRFRITGSVSHANFQTIPYVAPIA